MTRHIRFSAPRVCAALIIGFLAVPAAQGNKRPIAHSDFDAWRSIFTPTLSRDGRYLAYSFMPQDADGDLVVRDLKSGQERPGGGGAPPLIKVPVGALPPPPVQNPEEVNPEEPPPPRSIRIAITSDSRFVVATTFPSKSEIAQAKRDRKKADEMPKGGLVVVNLASGEVSRVAAIKSMQVPARGGSWIACLKERSPGLPPSHEASADRRSLGGGGQTREGRASRGDRAEYGTDLVLRDLAKGIDRTLPNVVEYSFARDGKTLLYAVSARTDTENGVYSVTPTTADAPVALLAGKGKYAKLTWNRAESEIAFISDRDDAVSEPSRFKVYRWQRGAPAAVEAVSSSTPGFPSQFAISERGTLAFSRNGQKLYVPAAPPSRTTSDPELQVPNEDRVVLDLWHWKDDLVQPMQRVRANQERNRTYRGVYHIAEQKYVQVADLTLRTVLLSDDGRRAVGYDDAPYRRMVDYDGTYNDVYVIDTATGARTLVLKQLRSGGRRGSGGGLQWSPDGKFAFYFQDKHWHLLDVAAGTTRNVTSGIGVAVHDEEDDTPDPASSHGQAGWTHDSQAFLVYDRFDVWQIFADGRPARNLTEGEGRRTKTVLRVQQLDDVSPAAQGGPPAAQSTAPLDEDDERGLDPKEPLYLRGVSEETRASGFFKDSFSGTATPQKLLWADKNYRLAARAADADAVLVAASRFDEYPDLHATDASFRSLKKVTNGGAQKDPFVWGSGALVRFRNTDGVPLSAALYKPENFDPKKKYPLMVYIYERLSQNVHNFVDPRPSHSVNFALYVSNGYIVLAPDIVYTIGQPGQSALKCVLPAIQAVVDKGFVDENAIGIQGHSWGGYQIAYMVTQTNRFRAAEAGAPVGNMTSAYSGIRWGSGLPRQFQYEGAQSRIGRPLYDAPHKYIENSPIFHVQRVATPLLILHDDQDDAVPWYQGIELFLALRRTGKEAYLFNYNGELHGLRRRHNQKDYALRMHQFFDHFLKGAPKPEWMEKGIPFIEREQEKERIQKTKTM
jgi:dipeptidyl aminopeptidase/acylaminoacyl peptidase